jgi:hypothetical protein
MIIVHLIQLLHLPLKLIKFLPLLFSHKVGRLPNSTHERHTSSLASRQTPENSVSSTTQTLLLVNKSQSFSLTSADQQLRRPVTSHRSQTQGLAKHIASHHRQNQGLTNCSKTEKATAYEGAKIMKKCGQSVRCRRLLYIHNSITSGELQLLQLGYVITSLMCNMASTKTKTSCMQDQNAGGTPKLLQGETTSIIAAR